MITMFVVRRITLLPKREVSDTYFPIEYLANDYMRECAAAGDDCSLSRIDCG